MKITVNQLRRIIREEIEKTVETYVEDEHPFVSLEQRVKLDKIKNKFQDLSKMFTQEEMANALAGYYTEVPGIMGAESFTDSKVFSGLRYMFPNIDGYTWRLSGDLADSKARIYSRSTPQDVVGIKYKPEDEKYKP